jgi:malate dehydrogenase
MLDIAPAMNVLKGVVMEIEDLAYPLVAGVVATSDLEPAFKDIDYAIFLGAFPRKQGMERKDLMEKNVGIFKEQGQALANFAKATCKSLVVGNPANTNCLTLMTYATKIPRENFSALTRLDHNRAKSALAIKTGVNVDEIRNSIIWGNHSSTQFPDIHTATVAGKKATQVVDDQWYKETFIPMVQKRGAAVIAARGMSSAASAAKAAADHVRDWVLGTSEPVSMAVVSDGNPYGIPDGLMFSFPVTCEHGSWRIVPGFEISAFARDMLAKTTAELQEEKALAEEILKA